MNSSVKLNICGIECQVTSDDDEAYIRSVGEEVDMRMNQLLETNQHASTTMVAVLCALTYADECRKANIGSDNLRAQIKSYSEDSRRARLEADEAKREVDRLRRELQALRLRLAEYDDR